MTKRNGKPRNKPAAPEQAEYEVVATEAASTALAPPQGQPEGKALAPIGREPSAIRQGFADLVADHGLGFARQVLRGDVMVKVRDAEGKETGVTVSASVPDRARVLDIASRYSLPPAQQFAVSWKVAGPENIRALFVKLEQLLTERGINAQEFGEELARRCLADAETAPLVSAEKVAALPGPSNFN